MSETNWIALSERKPTDEDADDNGYLWVNVLGYTCARLNYWEELDKNTIAFHPIPKRQVPPLPKPVEKSQGAKDLEKAIELNDRRNTGFIGDILDGMQWARAEERKRFAAECLVLFDHPCPRDLLSISNILVKPDTAAAIRRLHELLTEAAEKS